MYNQVQTSVIILEVDYIQVITYRYLPLSISSIPMITNNRR